MIGFIVTIIGGSVIGWFLRGKADKKPAYHDSSYDKDED